MSCDSPPCMSCDEGEERSIATKQLRNESDETVERTIEDLSNNFVRYSVTETRSRLFSGGAVMKIAQRSFCDRSNSSCKTN